MKILNILNGLDCGINWWDETNRRGIVDYRYLASIAIIHNNNLYTDITSFIRFTI